LGLLFLLIPDKKNDSAKSFSFRDNGRTVPVGGKRLGVRMSKKISGVVALLGVCALSLFLLDCGSSSSRPSGVLYVLTQGSNGVGNNVSSFAMDLNNGNLSLINSNAPTCQPAGGSCGVPLQILLDPAGASAFVLNQGVQSTSTAPTIYSYNVNSDGSLGAPALAQTLTVGDLPTDMTRDDAGQFLFVTTQGFFPPRTDCPPASSSDPGFAGCPSISVFAIQGTALTAAAGSPLYLSKVPSALSAVIFTPSGSSTAQEILFATNNQDICTVNCIPPSPHNDNTVSEYLVSSAGSLTEQPNSPYAIAAPNPVSVLAVNTNPVGGNTGGVFVYIGNSDANGGDLNPFLLCTVVGNGGCKLQDVQNNLLAPLQEQCAQPPCKTVPPTVVGQNPLALVVDPTNNFLYVASEGANTVYGFRINTSAGTLAALAPANQPTGSQPLSMALHPSVNNTGQFLYISNSASDNISGFTLSTTTGSMNNPITVISPPTPTGLAVH
jgi:hypothetical protein